AANCADAAAAIVQAQWEDVWSAAAAAASRVSAGEEVFAALFKMVPAAKNLFTRVNVADINSPEFQGHVVRVMGGLDILINALDDIPTLESMLDHLAGQHAVRDGVTGAGFQLMATVLMESLPQVVEGFNPDAWASCLAGIAAAISSAL
uniref:hemoglobin B1a chain n=1 Tax=Riftia pachyptila TaxID=6426 RepID=UPI00004C9D0D|nr:Chain C, hemoglobin B1a chain [Riftia pachyptila]1YHU_G Chain G, hemoglobin B1a chain [Riftia pachyptila]1YHU_K Chain K, hemoglobin B1a chain [Riftia pachyptila]1YHU_O Chain O, hemoglobin B1a chain [Riftia pachyptila]1YHU_S Chain S, hemoglobin B1a chain [Riftia pachyptila]1YHU_W Chain W, hemoglobin B1a chain [Riftia pachyptila]